MEAVATPRTGLLNSAPMRVLGANGDVLLAVSVILILALMIIPIPAMLLDVLLAANITLAIVILMVSMYMTHPLELSVFPGLAPAADHLPPRAERGFDAPDSG